ncbi:Protein IVY1 [Pseudozyma hubeiensis]|nr:Protein IVY1 [Pseudozyma hubeiensis]
MPRPHSIRSLQMPMRHHDANSPFPAAPPSPSLSTTTRASLDFPSRPSVLITRADLRTSLSAYESLLASAKAYTSTMLSMAKASSDFACSLEACARVKGAHESGPGLQAASGLHFLKSNYLQLLCDTFWKDFSIPLLSHYDTYRSACTDRQVSHDKAVSQKSKELKEAEARNNRAGRKKERDLNSFRRALAELQSHVDAIDDLKASYYNEVLEAEQEVWQFIESKVALVVRSQIEISERISSKGLNDPVLESMLATIPDPFGSYGPAKTDGEIFSILPPISLISSGANSLHNTSTEAATTTGGNDTSATDVDVGEEGGKSVLPANIMSPSTPSKGLTRAGVKVSSNTPTRAANGGGDELPSASTPKNKASSSGSSTAATPKARSGSKTAALNGPTHLARDSLLGLSSVSEATTAVTSDSPNTATGGLFGSESMDFEDLLSRETSTVPSESKPTPAIVSTDEAENDPAAEATAAGRLRQVLSIIEEDVNGPLSKAAAMGTASRRVSGVYDAGPDPFASPTKENDAGKKRDGDRDNVDGGKEGGSSRHRRSSSKLSID